MTGHEWLAACLLTLAPWVVLSGLDDLFLQLTFCFLRLSGARRFRWPDEEELEGARPKRIAVFVPLWQEHRVAERMLEHNLAANRYPFCDFFAGVYPNDPATAAGVGEVARRFPAVHLAVCPHDGPTSKADCLNWIYQHMLLYEEEHGVEFDAVVMHDAEDLIHPESLRVINYFLEDHDMVQVPVLPLPTPASEWTHGVYCDEFAEYQTKDIPVRQLLGGFIASNGVGTGFSRAVLRKLAERHSNRIFEPLALTEDYETGFRIHVLRCPQLFVPVTAARGGQMATREYFPRTFRGAVKQRTRWVMGISLQSWEYHGWHVPVRQLYWLWRDRKGLLGNLLNPVLNLMFLYGAGGWAWSLLTGRPWYAGALDMPGLRWVCSFGLASATLQLAVRMGCVGRIYGWRFAAGVPVRAVWANVLNCVATVLALKRYFRARLRKQPLVWLKTDHTYPSLGALMPHKRRLGDILVTLRHLSHDQLERSLASQPAGERIGEYLVRTGKLTEDRLYQALSVQHSLPLGMPAAISWHVTRSLPAGMARKWRVLPFQVTSGKLFVAGPDLPSDEMADELRRVSRLELRFQLVTPQQYRELASQYLQGA